MEKTIVSFDWAIKSLLRDKANFDILSGLLSELLGKEVAENELKKKDEVIADQAARIAELEAKLKGAARVSVNCYLPSFFWNRFGRQIWAIGCRPT